MKETKHTRRELAKHEVIHRWRQWLDNEGKALLEVGLPAELLQDEEHWIDFLQHGILHMHPSATGFTYKDIPEENAGKLVRFIESHYTAPNACDLYHLLKTRTKG